MPDPAHRRGHLRRRRPRQLLNVRDCSRPAILGRGRRSSRCSIASSRTCLDGCRDRSRNLAAHPRQRGACSLRDGRPARPDRPRHLAAAPDLHRLRAARAGPLHRAAPDLASEPLLDGRSARGVLDEQLATIERRLNDMAARSYRREAGGLLAHARFVADRLRPDPFQSWLADLGTRQPMAVPVVRAPADAGSATGAHGDGSRTGARAGLTTDGSLAMRLRVIGVSVARAECQLLVETSPSGVLPQESWIRLSALPLSRVRPTSPSHAAPGVGIRANGGSAAEETRPRSVARVRAVVGERLARDRDEVPRVASAGQRELQNAQRVVVAYLAARLDRAERYARRRPFLRRSRGSLVKRPVAPADRAAQIVRSRGRARSGPTLRGRHRGPARTPPDGSRWPLIEKRG